MDRGQRVFDVSVAWLLLLALAPLFCLVALATVLESRGPVFFRQRRALGHHDPPFDLFKFRSMVKGADESRDALEACNESDGPLFKLRHDPRTTRVGRFLRRHSLDELPQLINVIRGEMSLVGPRPLPVRDLERFRGEAELEGLVHLRTHSRPGMTGLWQVSGRSELGFRDMLLLDLYYIENRTMLVDVKLLWHTIPVVISGRGTS